VREALRRLTDEQLTVREPHRGTVVTSMGVEDILAVYAVRETLEGLAAHLAAQRQPEGMVETLTAVQAEMADADAAGDTARVAALNLEFHRRLREAGGNPYLDRFLTQIEHAVRRFGATTFRIPHRTAEAIAEHGAILDAIAAGDADLAAQRAIEHMRQAREARIRLLLTT
jgi:DNA-binding GntR family transcriptional regulator